MLVVGIDPGKATGVALVSVQDSFHLTLVESHELDFFQTCEWFKQVLGRGIDAVAVENFIITTQTGRNSQAPWSLWTIGAVQWILYEFENQHPERAEATDFALQMAGNAKAFVSNQMIKHTGLWHRGGAGHALDAIRHIVYYVAANKIVDAAALVDV